MIDKPFDCQKEKKQKTAKITDFYKIEEHNYYSDAIVGCWSRQSQYQQSTFS